jgi:prepilin-type processing-associated H-X9-DG protein/prepilin-type N-terminal cleavage/methylation domain-containing protein
MMSSPLSRLRAFSLLEVLVCVAVISMFAGILFPAYKLSIEHTNATKCTSILRSLTLAILASAADNNNQLPRSSHSAFAYRERGWSRNILPYLGEKENPSAPEWAEIRNRRFRCPGDPDPSAGQSYGLNVFFELDPTFEEYEGMPEQWRTLHSLQNAAKTILLGETQGNTDHIMSHFWVGEGGSGHDCAHDRHKGKANYAFADGHIKRLKLNEIYAPSRGINRWNPSLAGY